MPTPKRPTDQELLKLLHLAHGTLHQHAPLTSSHRPAINSLLRRLQAAWEGLEPTE